MYFLILADHHFQCMPNLPGLYDAMKMYYSSGMSPTTHRSYSTGLKQYIHFCSQASLPAIPASEHTLLLFVTHLATQNLSYSTIKVYMSAVRSAHVTTGNHTDFDSQLTPRLDRLLKGIRKEVSKIGSPKQRLPITMEIMTGIKSVLNKRPKTHYKTMMWAACCTAFFGLLRSGEFTVPSLHQYDPTTHLSLSDVSLDDRHVPQIVRLHIKQSKTDIYRNGTYIYLGRTDHNICPVQAIVSYLAIRGKHPGPLFMLPDSAMLTRNMFASLLKEILSQLNLDTQQYNTHSFRIGGATAAKHAGLSIVDIKTLGRWRSDAYQRYIKSSPKELASLSRLLIQQPTNQEH